ncbi:MAG: glycolate oxidase subunit GlcF [Betaproteobacteria bacterium]
MQTTLAGFIRDTREGREAEAILRKCVHCGFCTATCPTYQVLGDELDGPRGRIYLVKQVLEGVEPTAKTRLHLDRCLTCRSCETTCPSGVQYGRLLDIGRGIVERKTTRGPGDRVLRGLLAYVLPRRALFGFLLGLGRVFRSLLPATLREKVHPRGAATGVWPAPRHARRLLALGGCVQPALAPEINAAAARVLDRIGISLVEVEGAGCCGALRFHLNDHEGGKADMRDLIAAWVPQLEGGAEGVALTASGCGAMIAEYGHVLEGDAGAARVSQAARDISQVIEAEADAIGRLLPAGRKRGRVAFQSPCTLQHGLRVKGVVEALLERAGYELAPVRDAHLCCGSAGTYSVLQPEISTELRSRKLAALEEGGPAQIATANIGCLSHLQAGTAAPVRHWIQLLDDALQE